MATVTTFLKQGSIAADRAVQTMECVIDFSQRSCVANDVVQALTIPAKTVVLALVWEVITAEGDTLTFDVGDDVAGGGDVDGYVDGADGNAAASGLANAAGYTTGIFAAKYYSAADTIDVLILNDADTAKVRIMAKIMPFAALQP